MPVQVLLSAHPAAPRRLTIRAFSLILAGLLMAAVSPSLAAEADALGVGTRYIDVARVLSADDMAGRAVGTEGSRRARQYLLEKIGELGVQPVGDAFEHPFPRERNGASGEAESLPGGVNLLFRVDGRTDSEQVIVITAHYDHLGVHDGEIYNGADDNASGVAGLLAIAAHFTSRPPVNDIVFALLDAEEGGLDGARAFVSRYPRIDAVGLNINLDMISRSDSGELYAAGAYHTPALRPFIEALAARVPVTLIAGHDDPALGNQDWTGQSDHFAFHERAIPFLYFGVEDHPDYHRPSDTFDRIPQAFFAAAIETVIIAAAMADERLGSLTARRD